MFFILYFFFFFTFCLICFNLYVCMLFFLPCPCSLSLSSPMLFFILKYLWDKRWAQIFVHIITFQKVMVTTRLRKYKNLGFRGQILYYMKCIWGQETTKKKRKKHSYILSNFQENAHKMTKYEFNSYLRIWQESVKNWLWKRDKSTLIGFSKSSWDTYY